jgi:rhodanese-related sulfurtransferase
MRKSIYYLFSILVIAVMVITACGGNPTPTMESAVEVPVVEEPVAEEAVEVPEVEEAPQEAEVEPAEEIVDEEPVDLDAAFQNMLDDMEAYNTVKADALLTEMVEDTPPFLLDVRSKEEVEENGHIEGAVNIPLSELAKNLDLLPGFETPVVAYCGSGWRATIAMTALSALGWEDVRALKATFADWKEAGNPVVEGPAQTPMVLEVASPATGMVELIDGVLSTYGVKPFGVMTADDLNLALVDDPEVQIVDVRTQGEVDEKGIIDASNNTHISLEDLIKNQDKWPAKGASVLVYCGSGHRSTMAMTILWAYGYTDVRSLKGGYGGWADAGFPTVGGLMAEVSSYEANFAFMLANMEGYNTVKADGLMTELIEDEPPFLLDVRTTAELEENGHIEGATHIPLAELAQHIDLLPSFETPIVTYCGSGWRATIAMTALYGMGWTDVRALKTSFSDWITAGNPIAAGIPEPMALNVATVDDDLLNTADVVLTQFGVRPYANITGEGLNTWLVENGVGNVLDVRRGEELVEKGVIDTGDAEFIPIALEGFITDKEMWPSDVDTPVFIYCGSGHRSTMAATMLGFYGYTNVSSLRGGFSGWVEAEYPVSEYAMP